MDDDDNNDDDLNSPAFTEAEMSQLRGLTRPVGPGSDNSPPSDDLREVLALVRRTAAARGWDFVAIVREQLPAALRALTVEQRLRARSELDPGWFRVVLTTGVVELAMRERTVDNEALAVFLTSKWIDDGPVTLEGFREFRNRLAPIAEGAEHDPRLARPINSTSSETRLEVGRVLFMRVAIDTLIEGLEIASTTNRRIVLEVLEGIEGTDTRVDSLAERASSRRESVRLYLQQLALSEAQALGVTSPEDRELFARRFTRHLDKRSSGRGVGHPSRISLGDHAQPTHRSGLNCCQ